MAQNVIEGRRMPAREDYHAWCDAAQARIDAAADGLIRASAATGWGCGDPFEDAVRWLAEAAVRNGHSTTSDLSVAVAVGAGTVSDAPALPPPTGRLAPKTPTAQHRRMHRLADRDGGWICQACGVGLIDMCSNDDMVTDQFDRRMVRPDCPKRVGVIDHRVPIYLHGSNHDDNVHLTCEPCNSRKGAS
jgi:hypothetical protein